jgi:hypothetical protein
MRLLPALLGNLDKPLPPKLSASFLLQEWGNSICENFLLAFSYQGKDWTQGK